jgi:hypothetical protein
MNFKSGTKVLVLSLAMFAVTSFFGQFPNAGNIQIADYRVGGLINVPQFVAQPYFLAAKEGCPIKDEPVCGVNGKTYQNKCFMEKEGVAKAYDGWCVGGNAKVEPNIPKEDDPFGETEEHGFLRFGSVNAGDFPCNNNYYPTCSMNGITFANLCRLRSKGQFPAHVGPCRSMNYVAAPNVICKASPNGATAPVCGNDDVTYEGTAVMECAGATFKSNGSCQAPCGCTFTFKPVCGIDGRNYFNECEMKCAKVQKAFDGRCDCMENQKCSHCIGEISKVCGKNGKSYDNLCYLKCDNAEFDYDGNCLPRPAEGCVCPKVFLPVCATDNTTYDNECSAKCAKKTIAHAGACKLKDPHHSWDQHPEQIEMCLKGCSQFGHQPVCGSDGKTYGNKCATTCSSVLSVNVAHEKECELVYHDHCPCNSEKKPVCGVDGKTYLNICTIQCVGMNKAWDGECGVIGNYGYIMSKYHENGTGAGPSTEGVVTKREKRSKKARSDSYGSESDEKSYKDDEMKKVPAPVPAPMYPPTPYPNHPPTPYPNHPPTPYPNHPPTPYPNYPPTPYPNHPPTPYPNYPPSPAPEPTPTPAPVPTPKPKKKKGGKKAKKAKIIVGSTAA